jgi:hypothetical protein
MYQGDTSSYVMYGVLDTSERFDNCNGHGGGNDYDKGCRLLLVAFSLLAQVVIGEFKTTEAYFDL